MWVDFWVWMVTVVSIMAVAYYWGYDSGYAKGYTDGADRVWQEQEKAKKREEEQGVAGPSDQG